jgi:hypothetical protein
MLAGNHGATVLRYQHGDLRSFGDLIHLNGTGSTAFSQRLALDIAQVVPHVFAPDGPTPPAGSDAPADVAAPGVPLPSVPTPSTPLSPDLPAPPPVDPALPATPEPPPVVVAPAITIPSVPAVPDVTVPALPVDPALGDLPEDSLETPVAGG